MAAVLLALAVPFPLPARASSVWPQKATAPFYCLDGGKGWKQVDRYDIYEYDTLPSPLTEPQTKRLFWAYPSNWTALKEAARKFDPELYGEIASTASGPNVVKRVKDDPSTRFAWVADHPEIEERAIAAMEQMAADGGEKGKEAPDAIRDATSEETAVPFTVLPFSDGPGALDTEFFLGSEFIRDIAKIEPQSVWDNGSTGGNVGWLDASQDKNIARSVLGEELYEITWSGDSIKIHNNGSATANENALDSTMTEEQKYNKTMVRYKITMRKNSGWYTEGSWNDDYLHEWMDFKACVNAPQHQRLYKAGIEIVPSDMVFYIVVSQEGDGGGPDDDREPAYGGGEPELSFQVFRHEETFQSDYNVRLKKLDDETGMPLKGSQFYLYERFEDGGSLGTDERGAGLSTENISFAPWDGFQIFAEGTTDENGEISHTDSRSYVYSKTYCDGHGVPQWADIPQKDPGSDTGKEDRSGDASWEEAAEVTRDKNRAAAEEWLSLVEACEAEAEGGVHFHWVSDESAFDQVAGVLESGTGGGEAREQDKGGPEEDTGSGSAFEASGCRADCEETYENFTSLRFTYTWKEIQARNGYILHGLHNDDIPVELVTTTSSQNGAVCSRAEGDSGDITENIWYTGSRDSGEIQAETAGRKVQTLKASGISTPSDTERLLTPSNAGRIFTSSNAWKLFSMLLADEGELEDEDWEEQGGGDFQSYLENARPDGIRHLETGDPGIFSHCNGEEGCGDSWIVKDHRTEGEIHINKRDLNLYKGESEEYSSFGDTEGDGSLEGAVYGLFAAEDIVHPDSELGRDGKLINTGIVYKKDDLTAVAATDRDGNAGFTVYTEAPGTTFDYDVGKTVRRTDPGWEGPGNRYGENLSVNGNCWIGRPLLLGRYYVKELSRSEGYELSVNGRSGQWTNKGAGFETPEGAASLRGMSVVSMPELSASMEGEDGSGNGFDQLPFMVTSSGTVDPESGTGGYELIFSGFPEDTEFFRVDTGEKEVTGPHVTGTEEVPVKDENGDQVWKTADTDRSHVRYEPEYGPDGRITGQHPMSRTEPQILRAEHVPQTPVMGLTDLELDETEPMLREKAADHDLTDPEDPAFRYLKAEVEEILNRNGYEIPVMADGTCSSRELPVYSRGVKKGQTDIFGMTAAPGEPAVKTHYGAAVTTLSLEGLGPDAEIAAVLEKILLWYAEHPQWSFGGIDAFEMSGDTCCAVLYAGASVRGSRRFFTMKEENGKAEVDKVYSVLEDPVHLRWMYQEYSREGSHCFQTERRYYMGSGAGKRYYIDVVLTPAVLVDGKGQLQDMDHQVMVYHEAGERIVDYIDGDPEHGWQVPLTETIDKIEITTEKELADTDVRLEQAEYDRKMGIHRVRVASKGTDSFGKAFSDENGRLTLSFMAKLPRKQTVLTKAEVDSLGAGNVYGYRAGDPIGFAEYLARFGNISISASAFTGDGGADTYIVAKHLVYRGQHKITEDGDTVLAPVQVLERPVRQMVKVVKDVDSGEALGNFRFKIYLRSNLERLYCDEDGAITWTDKNGTAVDVDQYHRVFPELVQKLYTVKTERSVLEDHNYEKFFHAVRTADTDKWDLEGQVVNSSFKPFARSLLTGVENTVNSSPEARENAKRSDAVRQFAVTWYLEDQVKEELAENGAEAAYGDQVYDRALYKAILRAEEYLEPFFKYDLDSLYSIRWDSEENGGIDRDKTTLSAWQLKMQGGEAEYAFGISEYLPYGTYVLAEQQPFKAQWMDFENRHYRIDPPKEIVLPSVYEDGWAEIPDRLSEELVYNSKEPPEKTAGRYRIRFDGVKKGNEREPDGKYVVKGHGHRGDFYVYPYGEERDRSSWDGKYAHMLEPWSQTEDFVFRTFLNRLYRTRLRIEKLDAETGEQILHDEAVFALYKADRNEEKDGDGAVKRYEAETVIQGSRAFLEAMGARGIMPFARIQGPGSLFYGTVPAGTPVCREEDCIIFRDQSGVRTGDFLALSSVYDGDEGEPLQITGYVETPEPLTAGMYVLAELLAPAGYARSLPVPVEIYSDGIWYYTGDSQDKRAAVRFSSRKEGEDEAVEDTARIYVNNTGVSLEVSKVKTPASYEGMKVSGRVEGSLSFLEAVYGLENLEPAYNSMGTYQGFGWKKGTLEYLEERKAAGERVEIVYENGIFQGYGYVTRTLETAGDQNRYVAGAEMALFEAIEVRPSGDMGDHRMEGVEIQRDRNGNVLDIQVKKGYAGSAFRLKKDDNGRWSLQEEKRDDTSVLFYDLGNLKVLETGEDGIVYGFGRDGEKIRITPDTRSVYAFQGGQPFLELAGGDLSRLVYDPGAKAFLSMDPGTEIYHLNQEMQRDACVDPYTGLAYVEKSGTGPLGKDEAHYFVWPVISFYDPYGNRIAREKILTGRPGEVNAGTENAYLTGTWDPETGKLEKRLKPFYDSYGMVRYYPVNGETYKKGEAVYDRDGDYLYFRYDDLLEQYHKASYTIGEPETLYDVGDPETEGDGKPVRHRNGEFWIIPNLWISGERSPQDPSEGEMTWGQADMLRRVIPGTYIMEETGVPPGYTRAFPQAVRVEETRDIQRTTMTDEKIRVEILKTDGTETYRIPVVNGESGQTEEWTVEGKGFYSHQMVKGAELALYPARRVYSKDLEKYPKGYYLVKKGNTPAVWNTEDPVDNHPVSKTARWITDGRPMYFEGIPAGDYILEELKTPPGYLPSSMEITIRPVDELQSFVLKDDHTKVEIYKYEEDEKGIRRPLPERHGAGLALYPAVLEENGTVMTENGAYVYQKGNPVDTWTADDLSFYGTELSQAYEAMFREYGEDFERFSWKVYDGKRTGTGERTESRSTGNGETVVQLWSLSDGSCLRVTASRTGPDGDWKFEYQYHYKTGMFRDAPAACSFDTRGGLHRIDRIPEGYYVLVETETPGGYETAEPVLVQVKKENQVIRYYMENRRRQWYADKTDENGRQIRGARLALYRADENGGFSAEEELLEDTWTSGGEGTYTADDLAEGRIPEGYGPGDLRLHRLPPVREGTYYLAELRTPDHFSAMEPQKIEIGKDSGGIIQAVNRLSRGQIEILKLDAQWHEKPLPGAWFEVKNAKTGELFRMVTGSDGKAVSGELPAAYLGDDGRAVPYEYQVREIQAPEGFCLDHRVWKFWFNNDHTPVAVQKIKAENEETRLWFSKSSFHTDHFVKGARLSIYNAKAENGKMQPWGEPLETWISGPEPHLVSGKLSGGRTYFLVEEEAPEGYSAADPVMFTVSADGRSIAEISGASSLIQILYDAEKDRIGSILVRGRRVQGGWITLKRDGKEILTAPMTGELTAFREAVEQENTGAVLTWEEAIGFSDGSSMLLERETICLSDENRERILESRKRVPVGTRYVFCGQGHTVLDTWKTEGGGLTHEIVNEENGQGELLFAKGEAYTLEEIVVFSDGTEFLSGRVSVSIGENGKMILADLKNKETDVRIRKTDLITGEEISGAVLSIKSLDGKLLKEWVSGEEIQITGILKPGETYLLAEVLPATGYAWAEEIPFTVGGDGGIHRVRMEDRPTQAEIRKTDMVTGEELPGAVLVLKDKNGRVVDRWTSGNTPHRIMGRLNAGEAYTLSEVTAPSGYQIAEEVTFTVSEDGTIDRVVMEDKRKEPEEPEKPGKPEKPERPVPDDDRETEPETPDETETPETEPTEEPRKKGIITARYEIELDGRGELRISHPSRIRTKIPRAGDQQRPWVYGALAVLGILGGSICLILWRRDTFEK